MSGSSIVVMIIGMVVLWGGLAASIWHAAKMNRKSKE